MTKNSPYYICGGIVAKYDKKPKVRVWNLEVPQSLDEALEEAIKRDWHRTKAEFIRDAVRRALMEMGFLVKSERNVAKNE
jgi:metal-responsive CopG/Arc/MetJ family transcriptional regulator